MDIIEQRERAARIQKRRALARVRARGRATASETARKFVRHVQELFRPDPDTPEVTEDEA